MNGRRRRRGLLGGLARVVVAGALVVVAVVVARGLITGHLDRLDHGRALHPDGTRVSAGIAPEVRPTLPLTWREADGRIMRALVDAEAYGAFVAGAAAELEQRRLVALEAAGPAVEAESAPVFAAMGERIPAFVDWYLAWPTGWDMAGQAVLAASGWVVSMDRLGLGERVALDLERYVQHRFQALVLRPEVHDQELRDAFAAALDELRRHYREALLAVDARFQELVREHTRHLQALERADVRLDWDRQRLRLSTAGYERAYGPRLAAGTALMLTARSAGAAAARQVAARASAQAGGRLAGTGLGALGAGVGLVAALGVDYGLNAVLAARQRPGLEADAEEALAAMRAQWRRAFATALSEAVEAWFDDALHLLPAHPAAGRSR